MVKRGDFQGDNGFIVLTFHDNGEPRARPVQGRALLDVAEFRGLACAAETGSGIPWADTFRLPMKNLDQPWYEATRVFGPYNGHPEFCEDWNLETGGNSDFGEPLVAPFSGIVINAYNANGAWGRIVRILGLTPRWELITWMGAHLAEIAVEAGQIVRVGDDIGAIGNVRGRYAAHLHEQICVGQVPGPEVYGTARHYDFRQPSQFYLQHGVDADLIARVTERDDA